LQLTGIVDVNRFPFREDVQGRGARFPVPVAGCFCAAKRQVHLGADGRGVHVEDAGIEVSHRGERTVDILSDLRCQGVPLYALSNWSAETFPFALKRFEFLKWFKGIMLSGEVGLVKPDPKIYDLFLKTFAINPASAVYIDDLEPNVEGAAAFGMHGILFTDPAALRTDLRRAEVISVLT